MPKYDNLNELPVNESRVFSSPLEGDGTLVRTGTISEGSCFFHSILHACSREYIRLDVPGRMRYVKDLRKHLSDKLDYDTLEKLGSGELAKILFQSKMNTVLNDFYAFMRSNNTEFDDVSKNIVKLVLKDQTDIECYTLITELIPMKEGFEQVIFPRSFEKNSKIKMNDMHVVIMREVVSFLKENKDFKYLSKRRSNYIIRKTWTLVEIVAEQVRKHVFLEFKENLENPSKDIDTYMLEYVSNNFDKDIYFIDDNTRLPYKNCYTENNIKNRTSVIILWVNKNHYEIIGRLESNNNIEREFNKNDEIIRKINMFLFNPDSVKETYPELQIDAKHFH